MSSQGSTGNVVAAVCSFFIPGLGQLVQGRLAAAAIFFVVVGVLWALTPVTLGISALPAFVLHVWCIVDAARFKP